MLSNVWTRILFAGFIAFSTKIGIRLSAALTKNNKTLSFLKTIRGILTWYLLRPAQKKIQLVQSGRYAKYFRA